MFTLIGLGRVRGVRLQPRRDRCCPASSRRHSAARTARSASTSRLPPSSSPSSCSARCSSCAPVAQPAPPSSKLLGLAPKTARRLTTDGSDEDVPLEAVAVGDRLRVRPGEKVPVDGIVARGGELASTSRWSRASRSRSEKHAGDHLIGATVNGTGSLVMRAEKVGADTLLSRIVAMVAEAQRSRAPIQRLADVVSGYFVPVVVRGRGSHLCRVERSSAPSRAWRTRSSMRWPSSSSLALARSGWRRPCRSWSRPGRAPRWASSFATPRPSRSCARSTRSSSTRPARSPRASRS